MKSFIANVNLVSLLTTGHYKKKGREVNWTRRETPTLTFWILKLLYQTVITPKQV